MYRKPVFNGLAMVNFGSVCNGARLCAATIERIKHSACSIDIACTFRRCIQMITSNKWWSGMVFRSATVTDKPLSHKRTFHFCFSDMRPATRIFKEGTSTKRKRDLKKSNQSKMTQLTFGNDQWHVELQEPRDILGLNHQHKFLACLMFQQKPGSFLDEGWHQIL